MKKAIIYVFSGTGNTKLIAELFKKYLTDYETTIYSVRMNNILENPPQIQENTLILKKKNAKFAFYNVPSPNGADLIAFANPVHGFNTPKAMYDFICLMPALKNPVKTILLKTSGEGLGINDYSSQKYLKILSEKNYDVLCERRFVMPYNMIFRHSPEMVKSEYWYADAYVRLTCEQLKNDSFWENVKKNPLKYWFVPIVRILWIYAKVQGPTMFASKKKCIKCGLCVKNCPLNNIKFDGKSYKFGTNCVLCVACSFNCPKKAISIGLLNGWRVNGSYKIEKTAQDSKILFGAFGENLHGLKKWAYYKYFKNLENLLKENNIEIKTE